MSSAQHPLELIQARTLLGHLSTPGFLVDTEGTLVYYNEAAGEILGLRFEEAGPMTAEDWGSRFEPSDPEGEKVPVRDLPLAVAFREQRAGHARLRIRPADGGEREIYVTAFPLFSSDVMHGAVAIFWPVDEGG